TVPAFDEQHSIYVSSSTGLDTNSGLDAAHPIAKLTGSLGVEGKLVNNTVVYLKYGDIFDFTGESKCWDIITAMSHIRIKPYGNPALGKPKLVCPETGAAAGRGAFTIRDVIG